MRWRDLLRNGAFLIQHTYRQKMRGPISNWQWARKRRPFVFKTARKFRMRLQPGQYVDSRVFAEGVYERRFLEFLLERLGQGGAMLDVGANIGNHALFLSDKFDQVHCFEPSPASLSLLRANLALNDMTNIHIHPVGLGSRSGTFFFREVKDNLGLSKFVPTPDDTTSELRVVTGDQVVREKRIKDVRYVKIDVEGYELEVIRGLQKTISQFSPIVSFEYHGSTSNDFAKIKAALKEYDLYEPILEPRDISNYKKALFYLLNAKNTPLVRVVQPEKRYYPYIIALPIARLEDASFFSGL